MFCFPPVAGWAMIRGMDEPERKRRGPMGLLVEFLKRGPRSVASALFTALIFWVFAALLLLLYASFFVVHSVSTHWRP